MSEVQTVAKPKLTTAEKIAALRAKAVELVSQANELQAGLDREAALANVGRGDRVTFEYGRKENRATYEGEVLSAFDSEAGRKVKVLTGEGDSIQLFELRVADLSGIVPVETAPVADVDPLANAA